MGGCHWSIVAKTTLVLQEVCGVTAVHIILYFGEKKQRNKEKSKSKIENNV